MQSDTTNIKHSMGLLSDDEHEMQVISLLGFSLKHDIVDVTEQALQATYNVLLPMFRKNRAATEAYYSRLLEKCRDLDSRLELDTSTDLASQPAWAKYCKECSNLAVLRNIFDGKLPNISKLSRSLLSDISERMRREWQQGLDLDKIYVYTIEGVFDDTTAVELTGREIQGMADVAFTSLRKKLEAGQVVKEYYRLRAYCNENATKVLIPWKHRPSKYKQWKEYFEACHTAGMYVSMLHCKPIAILPEGSIESREELVDSDSELAAQGAEEESALPSTQEDIGALSDSLRQSSLESDGSNETFSVLFNDVTDAADHQAGEPYFCLVRDKLVYVIDESTLGLAGKHGKTWEPQPPNILVCQLQPEHGVKIDMSHVLPNQPISFVVPVGKLPPIHDYVFKKCAGTDWRRRARAVHVYETFLEDVSAMDMRQLVCQKEIGIDSAEESIRNCALHSMNMLHLRQLLYGTPFPIGLTKETLPLVIPGLLKHGIQLDISW